MATAVVDTPSTVDTPLTVDSPPTFDAPPTGIAALSRAAVARAADLVQSIERAVVGESKIRTAQGNAYAALCADRARATTAVVAPRAFLHAPNPQSRTRRVPACVRWCLLPERPTVDGGAAVV